VNSGAQQQGSKEAGKQGSKEAGKQGSKHHLVLLHETFLLHFFAAIDYSGVWGWESQIRPANFRHTKIDGVAA
jgi:hypothetical protein